MERYYPDDLNWDATLFTTIHNSFIISAQQSLENHSMSRLKCIGGPLYGQDYTHPHHEFIFQDKQTGKQTLYRRQSLDFTPPQEFFVAEAMSPRFAYHLALQLIQQE